MEQAHVPALGSWTSSPVDLSIPNRTGDPKGWQVAVTSRTFPALLNVPLGPAPLARPWSQPAFLLGKLPASSRCNIKPGGLSCCGMAADSKGQTLAPFHASSPPQTLSPCLGGDGALSQCSHHVGYMGTFTPVF